MLNRSIHGARQEGSLWGGKMRHKNIAIMINLFIFVILQIWPTFAVQEGKAASSLIVEYQKDELVLQAQETPLGDILDEINKVCLMEIFGLEDREDEQITFSFKGVIDEGLKRFLKHLGEGNYSFEFADEKLKRVVLSGEKTVSSSIPARKDRMVIQNKAITSVEIQSIEEGSQAEIVGLIEGDLIIEYDGIEIIAVRQLKKEVQEKADKEKIEIKVKRGEEVIPFVIKGGIIGVHIRTIKKSEDEDDGFE